MGVRNWMGCLLRGRPQEEYTETTDLEATHFSIVLFSVALLAAPLPSTCPAKMGNSGCTPSRRRTSRCRRSLSIEKSSIGMDKFSSDSFLQSVVLAEDVHSRDG